MALLLPLGSSALALPGFAVLWLGVDETEELGEGDVEIELDGDESSEDEEGSARCWMAGLLSAELGFGARSRPV